MSKTLTTIGIIALGLLLFIFLLMNFEAFSAFGAALLLSGVAIALFLIVDKFVFTSIDTDIELKKGNTAYAVTLLAVAIVIAACIHAAFSVFR